MGGLGAVALGLLSIAGLCATTLIDAPIRRLLLWGAVALYQVGVPLYAPTIPTMLLQCVPPYQRGAVMGLDGGVNTIARALSPHPRLHLQHSRPFRVLCGRERNGCALRCARSLPTVLRAPVDRP